MIRVDTVAFVRILSEVGRSLVTGVPRDLLADSRRGFAILSPTPMLSGLEHIPADGPLLLVANHWQRPGLWIGFVGITLAMGIAARRPGENVHWMVTDRWNIDVRGREYTIPLTRPMFRRVASNWDMIPLPTGKRQAGARTTAAREALRRAKAGQIVGLFPEGETAVAGPPGEALAGSGELAYLLGQRGVPTLPAAFVETESGAHARFGAPFFPDKASPSRQIMAAIQREFDIAAALSPSIY